MSLHHIILAGMGGTIHIQRHSHAGAFKGTGSLIFKESTSLRSSSKSRFQAMPASLLIPIGNPFLQWMIY
jgi:hypothetical protein